jgi:hypothetical protein
VKRLRFEWDERKATVNRRKHGVSFEEARTAFEDEDRFVLLGLSERLRTLVVCHCYRQGDEVIRLISARKANAFERQQYEDRRMK